MRLPQSSQKQRSKPSDDKAAVGRLHLDDDLADWLIVATARAAGLPVATRDQRIRRSRLVTLWTP